MTAIKSVGNSRLKKLKARLQRGQATVEYSIVTHGILVGGALSAVAPVIPSPGQDGSFLSIVGMIFTAMTRYYESIYLVLSSSSV